MSLCKTLTTSQQDFAVFAPSWQAGASGAQCTGKSLRNIDVENVNIVKTCEKLSFVLNENLKHIQDTSQKVDNEKQCAIRKSDISFRDFSNIWFGTLKIYQQQVNTLYRLSQDLFSRSSNFKVKPFKACKRNSSLTSNKLIKKRRLTLNESSKESYLTTNYTKLLDDLEELTRESTTVKLSEYLQNIPGSITQCHIREITLREISATTFNHLDELDEDSGFGEATHEEIEEFFNFNNRDILNIKRTTVKRKLTYVEDSPIKKSCLTNDSFVEPLKNENISFNEHVLKTSPIKRSNSQTRSLYEDGGQMKPMNLLSDNVKYNNFFKNDKIKKENFSDVDDTAIHCAKKKRRNLIIDDCIKIDMTDVIKAMKKSEPLTKRPRKAILKSFKKTRNITAFELLTRFNRRSLKLSLSLKQKFFLSREEFERDYLNLLREIFKTNYKEELASEIYPKWISFGNERKQNKQQCFNKPHKTNVILPEADVFNENEVLITNLASDDSNEGIPDLINNNIKVEITSTCKYDMWRPYDVMLKLLNLWRSNQTSKIAAYKLFKLAKSLIFRALGFNSLLHLSKKRFVNLIKFPGSIELQIISAGKNIERNCENYSHNNQLN